MSTNLMTYKIGYNEIEREYEELRERIEVLESEKRQRESNNADLQYLESW